jgi:hypothetical protein
MAGRTWDDYLREHEAVDYPDEMSIQDLGALWELAVGYKARFYQRGREDLTRSELEGHVLAQGVLDLLEQIRLGQSLLEDERHTFHGNC